MLWLIIYYILLIVPLYWFVREEEREREISEILHAADVSLKRTLHLHLNRSDDTSLEILEFAYHEFKSLQLFLGNRSSLWRITEAVNGLQDMLESHWRTLHRRRRRRRRVDFTALDDVRRREIDSFTKRVKEYIKEFEHVDCVQSATHLIGTNSKSKVVGLSDQVRKIVAMLTDPKSSELLFVSLLGMVGIGKTTLATEIFEHPSISRHFTRRVWLTLGPDYQSREILNRLALSNNRSVFIDRCLVVLDGVWNKEVLEHLERLSPHIMSESRVLLTTTLKEVALFPKTHQIYDMRFLDNQQSWCLLRDKVFDEMPCPPELEKPGKKIAENCEGLPLTIVTVARLLSKAEKSLDYWNKVAEKQNSVFLDAYDKMSELLFPSYNYLPQHLKTLFLYMGVFPEKHQIPYSKIIRLWIVEGFLERNLSKTWEDVADQCLKDLISRSVVIVHQHSTCNGIKTCRLHSVFWPLCTREARKNKFFHVIKSYADIVAEDVKIQPRFCIHNNILFGIKYLNNLMSSTSNVSSLLCTGLYHPYPVPIYLDDSKLLRILDALTVRFYLYPIQVLKLVELRYLALTYNGKLPTSISKLSNLECLIVGRHMAIRSAGKPQWLPVEIWDMKKLKHLQIMGNEVPDPCEGSVLPKLSTLSNISSHSCTRSVLESIPNLKKLGIRIEISSDAVSDCEPSSCFDHISLLNKLESLKCVIVNPTLKNPPLLSVFPLGLKKLCLSGLGYPWEEMSIIASLPNLEVLKLRCYAFRGPKWEIKDNRFMRLEFLLIEDSDLMHWTAGKESFRFLDCLSIKHCYRLKQVPRKFSSDLREIQVRDCSPFISNWAKLVSLKIDVHVHASWDE